MVTCLRQFYVFCEYTGTLLDALSMRHDAAHAITILRYQGVSNSMLGSTRGDLKHKGACLREHGVDGGDDEALRNAHEHARGHDAARAGRAARRQQAAGGPQREGRDERDAPAVLLRRPPPGHLRAGHDGVTPRTDANSAPEPPLFSCCCPVSMLLLLS